MLHQLASRHSEREVWWLHAARGPREHPFAAEARALLAGLPDAREHVFYSTAAGRLTKDKLAALDLLVSASVTTRRPSRSAAKRPG